VTFWPCPPVFLFNPSSLPSFHASYESRHRATATAEACAWLTGAGIYYGGLNFSDAALSAKGGGGSSGGDVLNDGKLLPSPPYPNEVSSKGSGGSSSRAGQPSHVPPLSLVLTEFHFLILNRKRLVAVNRLNEQVVFEDNFAPELVCHIHTTTPHLPLPPYRLIARLSLAYLQSILCMSALGALPIPPSTPSTPPSPFPMLAI